MTIFLLMRTIPIRQRLTLARRIAAGLPVWAAAKGSNLPAADVGDLMSEPEFRDLIGAWGEIFDLSPEARGERLERLAHMVVERRLAMDCGRTAHFILRERHRRRDPVARLAKGFAQLVDMEKASVERHAAAVPASEPEPVVAAPEPLTPGEAAVAEAEAAARLRGRPHPDDAMLWRRAGVLRQDMLGEQVLFGAVAEHAAAVQRGTFLEIEEVDAIEAAQIAAYEARLAEARDAEVEEAKLREATVDGAKGMGAPVRPATIPRPKSDAEAAEILLQLAADSPEYLLQLLDRWDEQQGRAAPRAASGKKAPQGP